MSNSNLSKVTVTFSITLDYQHFISEDELGDPASPYLDMIRNAETIEGAINISTDGQPDVHFRDVLAPWVQNLCFRGVGRLTQGHPLRVNYFGRSGAAEFLPQGSTIDLKTDYNPNASYPKSALLHALLNCGSRFLAFAGTVKKDDADYMVNLNYVKGFESWAHNTLNQSDMK